jgi:hypothetical protein
MLSYKNNPPKNSQGIRYPRAKVIGYRLRSESGQAIVLVSMMIVAFLSFFVFVVNTGILITAKISLQTAADAAAYSGAAVQAQQLNAISYLNYDMRRQYKKYIYRTAVLGSFARLAPAGFVNSSTPPPANGLFDFAIREFDTNGNVTAFSRPLYVPSVCLPMVENGSKDDSCVTANLPNTNAGLSNINVAGLTSLASATFAAITQLQKVQGQVCMGRGEINRHILMQWLFRSDLDPASSQALFNAAIPVGGSSKIAPQDLVNILTRVESITEGLGLYPREFIHLMRIRTLEKFINQEPMTDVTADIANNLEKNDKKAELYQRTIQAFQSARHNLNPNVFSLDDIYMTELQNREQLKLNPIEVDFDSFFHRIYASNPNNPDICSVITEKIPVLKLPVGVTWDGGMVHYAVRVRAKAKMFPFTEGFEMEAVAATKPFGSRIGPKSISFTDSIPSCGRFPTPGPAPGCSTPNLPISTTGNVSTLSPTYLESLHQVIRTLGNNKYTVPGFRAGLQAATAPNPVEIGQYTILPPPPKPEEEKWEFIPYWNPDSNASKSVYRFYAPLFEDGGDVKQKAIEFIDRAFAPVQLSGTGSQYQSFNPQQINSFLKGALLPYLETKLTAPKTVMTNGLYQAELAESMTFAAIELPADKGLVQSPNKFWLTNGNEIRTSWGPNHTRTSSTDYKARPRFGYSVKFVSFENLKSQGMNLTDDDLEKVKH